VFGPRVVDSDRVVTELEEGLVPWSHREYAHFGHWARVGRIEHWSGLGVCILGPQPHHHHLRRHHDGAQRHSGHQCTTPEREGSTPISQAPHGLVFSYPLEAPSKHHTVFMGLT